MTSLRFAVALIVGIAVAYAGSDGPGTFAVVESVADAANPNAVDYQLSRVGGGEGEREVLVHSPRPIELLSCDEGRILYAEETGRLLEMDQQSKVVRVVGELPEPLSEESKGHYVRVARSGSVLVAANTDAGDLRVEGTFRLYEVTREGRAKVLLAGHKRVSAMRMVAHDEAELILPDRVLRFNLDAGTYETTGVIPRELVGDLVYVRNGLSVHGSDAGKTITIRRDLHGPVVVAYRARGHFAGFADLDGSRESMLVIDVGIEEGDGRLVSKGDRLMEVQASTERSTEVYRSNGNMFSACFERR
ncbi:hypothetical protein [Rhizobacter sp. OV335]|uniref:hypothetical protein n=1 Tax=Rhizobacter sp. OV335 TaxID=1500264 RepID=UPI0009156879|nr:hypothetical protein [Rhizobacter sp. OV335]SHM90335.1 hypothetical protein SAMN02787076_02521 [Rhizobacter sp. OV335]